MAYIDTKYIGKCETCRNHRSFGCNTWCDHGEEYLPALSKIPTADVEEVRHGEWKLEVHSFYADNYDESIELCIYILAKCSNCGKEHSPKQVFSKHLYAPEDADDDFEFDQECEKQKALEEFKQGNYNLQKYCSECGAKMDGERSDT